MVYVEDLDLTGSDCITALESYNTDDPAWTAGVPSCEIDLGDWEESFSHDYAIEHNGAMLILPPCPMEDATNCVWDAAWRGNGEGTGLGTGQSFYDVDGVTYYVDNSTLNP
jgi:hypothetical protein